MFSGPGLSLHDAQGEVTPRAKGGQFSLPAYLSAIHIEVIDSMDTSSFINAFRRFQSIRGPVKHLRSDRGTNFIGASKDLEIPSNTDEKAMERFLIEHGCTWTFNTPHSSHMGGVWERMIGITRRILDSMLMQMRSSKLTHDMLTTFLAEVTAIVNNRPLVNNLPVSTDPADPFILTPASLLTQKVGPCPSSAGEFGAKVQRCASVAQTEPGDTATPQEVVTRPA